MNGVHEDVTGLHAISASSATNFAKSSKEGNSLPSIRATVTWRFQRVASHSGTFCSNFWSSSQSLHISNPFTCGVAWRQAMRKSENVRKPSASFEWTLGHFDSLSLKAFCTTKG